MSIGVKKCWKNTIQVLKRMFIRSSQVRMVPKQNNSPPLKTSQIQRKLFVEAALRSMLPLKHRTAEDASLFTSQCGSNQRIIDWQKRRNDGSSAVQPWLSTQWLFFIPAHQEIGMWSTIVVARRCCWSVQKSCFGGVSIGVQKQTHMTVVRQNVLSTIMLKNAQLFNANVRLQLATPEIIIIIILARTAEIGQGLGSILSCGTCKPEQT